MFYWSHGKNGEHIKLVHWNFHHVVANMLQMMIFEVTQDHAKERIKILHTLVKLVCPNFYHVFGLVSS